MDRMIGAALLLALAGSPAAAQQRVELPARDRALTLPTRTLFQVGAVEGEDYENFARVADVAFDARGNLYVLDSGGYRVIVFDANGRFVRIIGRQGGGPGEFGMPTAIAVLPGGELLVNDAGKGSLQVFSPGGEFLRTSPLPEDFGRAVGRMRAAPSGGIITETMPMRQLTGGQRPNLERMQLPPRSVTRLEFGDSVRAQRLFNSPPRELRMSAPQTSGGGQMRISMNVSAFEAPFLWTPLPDGGVAALNSAEYRVAITDPNGRPLRYLARAIQPRKVTEADRKKFLQAQKEGIGGARQSVVVGFAASGSDPGRPHGGSMPTLPTTMPDIKESDVNWGDVVPVVAALGTDALGRLWIQRTHPDLGDGPIDLVDARLNYLGTLARQPMPRAFGPGGRLAYVEKDDLDVQHIVVKQILK